MSNKNRGGKRSLEQASKPKGGVAEERFHQRGQGHHNDETFAQRMLRERTVAKASAKAHADLPQEPEPVSLSDDQSQREQGPSLRKRISAWLAQGRRSQAPAARATSTATEQLMRRNAKAK